MNQIQKMWDNLYNFSEDDIKVNAAGFLTEKQHAGFRFMLYRSAPAGAILGIILAPIIVQLTILQLRPTPNLETERSIFIWIMTLLIIAIYLFFGVLWWQLRRDFNDNQVLQVSGLARVGKYRFKVDDVGFWTSTIYPVEDGKVYRIYYLPRTKTILSYEELK
ncbi:MAG: hypothetical protein U0694_01175 [Anaerolineae bacterium]